MLRTAPGNRRCLQSSPARGPDRPSTSGDRAPESEPREATTRRGPVGPRAPISMVGLAAFGAMNAMLGSGASDRGGCGRFGWNRQLRSLPLTARTYSGRRYFVTGVHDGRSEPAVSVRLRRGLGVCLNELGVGCGLTALSSAGGLLPFAAALDSSLRPPADAGTRSDRRSRPGLRPRSSRASARTWFPDHRAGWMKSDSARPGPSLTGS
jgi:hypothetical protein